MNPSLVYVTVPILSCEGVGLKDALGPTSQSLTLLVFAQSSVRHAAMKLVSARIGAFLISRSLPSWNASCLMTEVTTASLGVSLVRLHLLHALDGRNASMTRRRLTGITLLHILEGLCAGCACL